MNQGTMTNEAQIDQYIRELGRSLESLRSHDRQEILLETRSHLHERSATGRLDEAFAAMGPAEVFAAGYCAHDGTANRAAPVGAKPLLLRFGVAAIALLLAVPCVFAFLMEIASPAEFGLWISTEDDFYVLGKHAGDNPLIRDAMGALMLPVSGLLSLLFAVVAVQAARSAIDLVQKP